MDQELGLKFINRGDELTFLKEAILRDSKSPALVFLRAPSGFGKSSLTDQLEKDVMISGNPICIVDPYLKGKHVGISAYDGFFIQRIAEAISDIADSRSNFPSFKDFLVKNRRALVSKKKKLDLISELPSLKQTYKIFFDYISRAFSFGNFSPEKLLHTDSSDAIKICTNYINYIFENHPLLLIIREAQHIDTLSLRNVLLASERHPGPDLIVEYTSNNAQFKNEHKLIFETLLRKADNSTILDLVQLSKKHLEMLIKDNISEKFDLESEYYLSWDGNVRSVMELKYKVSLGHNLLNSNVINTTLVNLNQQVIKHLESLKPTEIMIIAIVFANIEAIELTSLREVLYEINKFETESIVTGALENLTKEHFFIKVCNGFVSLDNDTVADAISGSPKLLSRVTLAEKSLREYYSRIILNIDSSKNLFNPARLYFLLCAKTKDISGILWAIDNLSDKVKASQDQSIYINAICTAIESIEDLKGTRFREVVSWGAELAYGAGDWYRVSQLLENRSNLFSRESFMLACALQEVGKHDKALEIARYQKELHPNDNNIHICSDLVEVLVVGGKGDTERAREILDRIVSCDDFKDSPLVGYGYRFYEIVDDLNSSLENLELSIQWFNKHSYFKSASYSMLPAAILYARKGKIEKAKQLMSKATSTLANELRDQHLILNNNCAIELLSEDIDYSYCVKILKQAIRYAKDDFSELTILTNLCIAYYGYGAELESLECADKCLRLLKQHDFADTNIYWPVCFNIAKVFKLYGNETTAKNVLSFPFENAPRRTDDIEYWNYRFGISESVPSSHMFLSKSEFHPLYLSHWLIDLEGLLELN